MDTVYRAAVEDTEYTTHTNKPLSEHLRATYPDAIRMLECIYQPSIVKLHGC